MNCVKTNFDGKETDLVYLKFVQGLKFEDIDSLIENIISTLRNSHLSVDIKSSNDPDNYEDSIKNLIKSIKNKISESNELKFNFNSSDSSRLTRKLKEAFMPPKKTKTDLAIEAIIPSEKMFSQEKINELVFKDVLTDIFGDDLIIRSIGEKEIKRKLLELTIIDIEHQEIVDTVKALNERLARFKGDEYKKLRDFVKTITGENGQTFDSTLIPDSYYYGEKSKANLSNVYTIMYNYIQYLKSTKQLDNYIKEAWNEKMTTEKSLFFDALNAYINLQFFDQRLKQCFGKYLQINRDYDEPITTEDNNKIYKYTLSTGNSEMIKGWETSDYQDAIDQMSGYSSILIETIPLLQYNKNNKTTIARFQTLNAVYFNNAIMNLRSAIENMADGVVLQQLLNETLDRPEAWGEIFEEIFKSSNSTIIKNLSKSKSINGSFYLNEFDLNILYSIYKQVFDKKNSKSYSVIENNYRRSTGVKRVYPIVGTFLGLMNSTAAMNYLELVYDNTSDVPGYKLNVKKKFNSNMTFWDMIKAVNRNTYSRLDKQNILNEYNLQSSSNEKEATLTFGNSPITVNFNRHILNKKSSVEFNKKLEGIFDEKGDLLIDLSTEEIKRSILNNPVSEQKLFLDMLSFIDNMLGTTFSKDVDGLTELAVFIKQGGKFSTLFGSAVRALKIIEIYNKIEKDPDYQKSQIVSYLENHPGTYNVEFWKSRDDLKPIIDKDLRGAYFTVLNTSEEWIRQLANARLIINGSVSKAVTKNAFGDSVPNFSPTYLGAELISYLQEAEIEKQASSKLLFSNTRNRSAIKSVVIDTDIKLKSGDTKAIKDMSEAEMIYHAIVDKFHLPLLGGKKNVFIQSTTFSDKTKYVVQEISLSDLGINVYSKNIARDCTQSLYNTVGAFYREIWKNVLDDYEKIFGTRNISEIESKLHNLSEQKFIDLANSVGVTVYKDIHYRPGLSINEILYTYAEDLYSSIENLNDRLNIERKQFVNDLINTRTNFYVTRTSEGHINVQDAIGNFISKYYDDSYESKWIKGNRLIFAKITDSSGRVRNVEYGSISLDSNETIELNPFLEAYFSTDVLISNNLRFSLTGSEINHKVKGNFNVVNALENKVPNMFGFNKDTTIVEAMETLRQIISNENNPNIELAKKAYNVIKNELVYSKEAAAQGAQLKRNVIIPGTMRHYLQNQINGTPPKMRIAVIDDVQAVVQNFDGSGCYNKKSKSYGSQTIDAHDGFAIINPIMSILENYSLQDNEVGDMKKNILHGYDHKYGTATLLKYAAGSMTNAWMRQSEMSPIQLRNIFKKMSNERWSKRYSDGTIEWLLTDGGTQTGEVNLLKCAYKSIRTRSLDFTRDILEEKRLFYNDKGVNKEIVDFGRDNRDYYTIEREVSSTGHPFQNSQLVKVYHYFDNAGKHLTETKQINNKFNDNGEEIYHTIDSIYELWSVLGGLESIELVDGKFQDSEASLYATTSFVNYVSNAKGEIPKDAEITQKYYDQPLKRAFISYLVNNSAIKNGAGNQNPTSSYYDNTPFRSITVKVKGHGVQLDADHHADEATMTEFSQVITSLDAGGRMHNYVRQIYNVLGKVALELSNIEIEAVEAFKNTQNKSKIYDLIGRTIMKNMKEGQKGLLKSIMDETKKEFNINSDHELDSFKIPFDDPNIYSQILSTFVSIINRKSIKRRYPGSGMVMMPGYDIQMIFDYNGQTYQYQDLIKVARQVISKEEQQAIIANDKSDYNRALVQKLLEKEQSKQQISDRVDWVNPADIVNVVIGDQVADINIETITDYYRFKGYNKRRLLAEKLFGVKVGKEYDKKWKPKKDKSHLNPDGSTKSNKAFAITLDGVKGYFEIVKDNEKRYWSIHFQTGLQNEKGEFIRDKNNYVIPNPNFTEEQKNILFQAAALVIPEGDYLSTYGELTPGGVAGLNRFESLGFTKVAERTVKDTLGNPINIPVYQSNIHIQFQKNVSKARNLAPVKINWKMPDDTIMNIFDHWTIKALYTTGIRNKEAIQRAFDKLNEGIYEEGYIDPKTGKAIYTGKIIKLDKNKIVSTEAECIVPNIFQSKFGLTSNQSLIGIINDESSFVIEPRVISSDNYDIVFTKNNNRNTYITFKPINSKQEDFESQIIPWDDTIVEELNENSDIVQRVFAVNKDNIKLFEIARKRITTSVVYNFKKEKFTDKKGNILEDQDKYTRYKDQVLETITFVQKRRVTETRDNKTSRYTLYNINKSALQEVYVDNGKKSIYDFIGMLMSDIYNSDDFNGVQLNTNMTTQSANILRLSLNQFSKNQAHNKALYDLIMGEDGLRNLLRASKNLKEENFTINKRFNKRALSKYYKDLSLERRASFEKSLYFTASRIPAQSHQSFMQMKAVGFTRGNVTHTFVSHFQTWLQGSDYDIDKSYMMGMSFNGVGKYVGWSNLFDYSSIETIIASEYLPMPNKTNFVKDELGTNIDKYVNTLNELNTTINQLEEILKNKLDYQTAKVKTKELKIAKANKIRVYADLLTYLNDNDIAEINWTIDTDEEIIQTLQYHEYTKIPKNMIEMASKNFISSHIQNTVQNFTNMIGAYSPIEMEDFRGASENSPKGEQSKRMTLMNPAVKYLMQYQNITGKNVIGIAATGIKGAFTWHYYMNEILQNPNEELISRAKFAFETSRIKGRAKNTIDFKTGQLNPEYNGHFVIKAIPDINWNNISEETKYLLLSSYNVKDNVIIGKLTVDLLQSQVLSAATDNAKELILAKVNAGSKLAKCYLFMITMGFDINDIVAFMTSPIISFIDKITESNVYTGGNLKIEDAIDLLKGKIPNKLIYKFMSKKDGQSFMRSKYFEQIKDAFVANTLDTIKIDKIENLTKFYSIIDFISELQQIRSLMPELDESNKADLQEFEHILEGANEFSNLGRLLGINQGIKTTESEFKSFLQFIQNIILTREKALGISEMTDEQLIQNGYDPNISKNFDVKRWLDDQDYKEVIKKYYGEKLKVTIPIFDIIEHIPQFESAFKLVNVVNIINSEISLKTKVQDIIFDHYEAQFWSDTFKNNLLRSIHAKFIQQFFYDSDYKLPYLGLQTIKETINGIETAKSISGATLIDSNFDEIEAPENGLLSFNSLSSLNSFKYIFENYIIPKLKEGKYITVKNGEIVEKTDNKLKNNKFVQGLISGEDRDLPLYRVNVDMLNYEQTPEGLMKVQNYIKGIQALQEIDVNGVPLSDWFILYNLYTNHNNYGSNRLTTLFDSFIDNSGKSSIIKDYLNYIGNLCFYGDVEWIKDNTILVNDGKGKTFEIDVKDLFMMSAITVSNTFGKGDPVYKVTQDSGSVFEERNGRTYQVMKNIFFSGDSKEETVNRQNIINSYNTVGGIAQESKLKLIENLNKLDSNTISAINELLTNNFFELRKICK